MSDKTILMKLACIGTASVLFLAMGTPAISASGTALAKFEPPDGYAYMGSVILYNDPAAANPSLPTQWEALVGKKASVLLGFRYFTAYDTFGNISSTNHPETSLQWCAAHNVTPMITWQPDRSNMAQYRSEDAIQAIANGSYDAYIRARADESKAFGKPIFIRFGHEFNFGGYAWSRHPDAYRAAWQRIVNIFRQEGATNVAFVWCANFPSVDYPAGLATIDQYYPGDSYVDWVGMDTYDISSWERNLTRMVSGFYQEYSVQKGKPMFLGEMGANDTLANDPAVNNGWPVSQDAMNKAQWVHDSLNDLVAEYPKIKGVTYWNDSIHGGSFALTGKWSWGGKTDRQWAQYYLNSSRYLTSVRDYGGSTAPTPTPMPSATPTTTPTPSMQYSVYTPSQWAKYGTSYAPIGQFAVKPGTTVKQNVYIQNTGKAQDSYTITVSGLNSAWYTVSIYGNTTVAPGGVQYAGVFITPGKAGNYTFTVKVTSKTHPTVSGSQAYTLHAV